MLRTGLMASGLDVWRPCTGAMQPGHAHVQQHVHTGARLPSPPMQGWHLPVHHRPLGGHSQLPSEPMGTGVAGLSHARARMGKEGAHGTALSCCRGMWGPLMPTWAPRGGNWKGLPASHTLTSAGPGTGGYRCLLESCPGWNLCRLPHPGCGREITGGCREGGTEGGI